MDISWKTTGSDITAVKLEYSKTGQEGEGDYTLISTTTNSYYAPDTNTFTWVDLPQDYETLTAKIRISSSTPLQPETYDVQSNVGIVGSIYMIEPNGSVDDIWYTDGVTANIIRWEIAGDVDYVKILYAQDGVTFDYDNPIILSTAADNETPGQYGTYHWTIPTNVTKDYPAIGCAVR
jgi:hypothetical protein